MLKGSLSLPTVTPALADLQLTTVGSDAVQVDWRAGDAGAARGYWLTWEEQQQNAIAGQRSSFYLPADSRSTRLTNIPPLARVCVSPIYRTARGDGLCCTAQFHTGESSAWPLSRETITEVEGKKFCLYFPRNSRTSFN